jgi:hypothetical protein
VLRDESLKLIDPLVQRHDLGEVLAYSPGHAVDVEQALGGGAVPALDDLHDRSPDLAIVRHLAAGVALKFGRRPLAHLGCLHPACEHDTSTEHISQRHIPVKYVTLKLG